MLPSHLLVPDETRLMVVRREHSTNNDPEGEARGINC